MSARTSPSNVSKKSGIFTFGRETVRLENEINNFTRYLEHERRLSLLLDKDLKEIKQNIANVKKSRNPKSNSSRAQEKVKALEVRLDAANKQLGEVRGQAKKLVIEINNMRRASYSFATGNISAKRELERARSQIIETNKESAELQKTVEKYNENIMSTHSRFESNRDILAQSVSLLKTNLIEDRFEGTKFRQGFTVKFAQPIADASEMHAIYKTQSQKWASKCEKTTAERERIRSHIHELTSALEEMKRQSKLTSLKDLVELFTSSVNEDSKLSHYLYTISEEIFQINEEVTKNKEKVNEITRSSGEETKVEIIERHKEALKKMRKEKEIATGKLKGLREKITFLPDGFKMMTDALVNLGINHEIDLPDLDEDTVTKVMFALEESVNSMMYWRNITIEKQPESTNSKQTLNVNEIDIEKLIEDDIPNLPMSTKEFQQKAIKSFRKLSDQ
ncbi:unnamed protein product [Blepharisma stoltei]|uniref:Uncharacterized protein n=1 Tax=Blepharisma stoltei TaxID=1481888 RepID=A0AAU9JB44_9CILI|nr:unnamed protein product [Blepharisma stoltei]